MFTLIHKFRTEPGTLHPVLSERDDIIVLTDEVRDEFLSQSNDVARLYKAVMPDPVIPQLAPKAQLIAELAKTIRAQKDPVNITEVMEKISGVLDGKGRTGCACEDDRSEQDRLRGAGEEVREEQDEEHRGAATEGADRAEAG